MADRKITALTELTAPVADDVFPVIDISEGDNANKNKKIQLTTILRGIPNGSASAPSVGFIGDTGTSGFFRVTDDEIGVSCNQVQIASFASTGLQLGSGTAAAQLHLFSTDTTDQVIIENTDTGADTAPDLVLFRNSASPAANDNLGNLVFRGQDDNGDAVDYATIAAQIVDVSNGSEDGILDIMSTAAGVTASRIRLKSEFVGIHEADPTFDLHLSTDNADAAFCIESSLSSAGSSADILLFHRRGDAGAGQDNDILSTITFQGKNDGANETDTVPAEIEYAAIESVIIDASDDTEDGQLNFQVMTAGTLTTKLAIDATGINITGTVTDDGAVHDGNVDLNGNIDVSGTSTLNNDVTFTGASANILFDKSDNALEFAHDAKSIYGDAANFQIYHNANGSFISHEATSAKLFIQTNSSAGIEINKGVSENIAKFIPDGAVEAYFDNVKRFETSATGINITGTVVDDGATHDGDVTFTGASANVVFDKSDNALEFANDAKAVFGANGEIEIFRSGSESLIVETQGNNLSLAGNRVNLLRADRNTVMLQAIANGAVELYHNNVLKAQTSSDGFDIPADSAKLKLGASGDLTLFHDGSDSYVLNNTGNLNLADTNHLYFRGNTSDKSVSVFFNGSEKLTTTSSGVTVTGTVTETSDIAFKSDIEPITNTLDKLQQITGYKYKLDNASIDSMGVIAQDVEKVFPELVHGDEGSKTLQYSGLIGVLVEAVKDLSAKVKKLESN